MSDGETGKEFISEWSTPRMQESHHLRTAFRVVTIAQGVYNKRTKVMAKKYAAILVRVVISSSPVLQSPDGAREFIPFRGQFWFLFWDICLQAFLFLEFEISWGGETPQRENSTQTAEIRKIMV